jgi:glycosyltransferase involved in cell wall biosynthesis
VTPQVSVVVITLDRLAFLQEAVASVQAQTGVTFELIVVDHDSSDGTAQWLAGRTDLTAVHALRDPSRSRSGNISLARNAGFAHARGDYVWFLDDDDRLRPGALATLAAALDTHPAAVCAVGARMRFGEGIVPGRVAHPLRRIVGDLGEELLLGWGWVPSMMLVRASTLRAAGGWNEDVPRADDVELTLRLACHGPVVLEPDTVVDYRIHHSINYGPHGAARDVLSKPYIERLAGGDLRHGLRLRAAGRRFARAVIAFDDEQDYPRALRCALAAAIRAPSLLLSPGIGPIAQRMIVRSALRCWGPTRRWVESRPQPAPRERPRRGLGFLN